MQTITIDIPQPIWNVESDLAALKQRIIEYLVLDEYQNGKISIREGARILGLTYEGFIDFLGNHHLSFINASRAELDESYQRFSSYMEHA